MKEVFSEAQIAGVKVKNKIIRSATHEGLADDLGNPTEALIKKYEALAKGDVGAIITGYAAIMQNGKSPLANMLMFDDDVKIPYYMKLVDQIHQYNTPIFLQITHCGRQTFSKTTGLPTVAPSPIKDKLYNEDIPQELNDAEIHEIIDNFVSAIERAKKAGFDGVQLQLSHGYLLSSFLSPHMNKRKDKWGGSTENRFRIIKEIMYWARERVGCYPIIAKINGYEKSKDGITLEEAVLIAKHLEESRCDGIEVSCGIAEEGFMALRGDFPFDMIAKHNHLMKRIPKIFYPVVKPVLKHSFASPEPRYLYNVNSAKKIKENVKIPVIVVGGIRKLEDIEEIINNEQSDFVSMSRPFIIEPNIVKKFMEGKQQQSKCIDCNYCQIGIEENPLKCYYGKI
ncbi:NADH:flavin oxidoreductase [Desulfosporosinus sp. OT]|uniref:NADH:flavin oxidoreductase n=1 Tax=Desulfosporosinus sp. OT TaxID=913865 RepID=UPI000223A764|nr:NADH:flavin oxidoreductase [Desulfosporosinus sp. OT]EGW39116.1 NADH:flavin oxidoreductase / NADH oxidase family protein [Desulfosporosinus sp. OT]